MNTDPAAAVRPLTDRQEITDRLLAYRVACCPPP